MRRTLSFVVSILFLVIGLAIILSRLTIQPAFAQTYAVPSQITVTMYVLEEDGRRTETLCDNADHAYDYGCTADPSQPYPYTTNPVTVSIEADYLLDVVPQEMSPVTFPDPALRAQAIAARTFAYWQIQYNNNINNSTSFQAFIPRRFDQFSAADQARIQNAVQPRYYLSVPASTLPIFSQFSTDAYLNPVAGDANEPYLKAISDTISYDPAIQTIVNTSGAHQRGMSQNGAGRWAWGNSSRAGTGTPWSVTWLDYRQILVHYYTGVHLRDSNQTLLTPDYRWNLLQYEPTAPLIPNEATAATILLQNTGTLPIEGGQFALFGAWCRTDDAGCPTRGQLLQAVPNDLPFLAVGEAYALTKVYGPPDGSTYRLVWDICTFLAPGRAERAQQDERWCFSYPPAGQLTWLRQEAGTVGSGPNPTATPLATLTPAPLPTATEIPLPTATPASTPGPSPTPSSWAAVENVILRGLKIEDVVNYSRLLSNLRDRVLEKDEQGKVYIDLSYRHAPELMKIMDENPTLRERAKRLAIQAQPGLEQWLAEGDSTQWAVSKRLRKQLQRLLLEIEPAASAELQTEVRWWRERLASWDGKSLPQIWQALLAEKR